MIRKLRSRRGESLVESLLAILIFTLASIVMYTMVTGAAKLNADARESGDAIQEQLAAAELAEGEPSASGAFILTLDGMEIGVVPVDIYGGEHGALYSYFADVPEEGQ